MFQIVMVKISQKQVFRGREAESDEGAEGERFLERRLLRKERKSNMSSVITEGTPFSR